MSDAARSFVENSVALLAIGDARGALRAASDACHANPGLPEAHYAYGQVWASLGDSQNAERAFAAALQLRPLWADAWVNYGVAHYRQGRIEEARIAMRRALASEPGHGAAIANLGAFMRISGDPEAAETLLREHLARRPDDIGTRLNLAPELLREERSAEALDLLAEMQPPADPDAFRHWRLQQALGHLQLNQPTEARGVLDTLTDRGPLPPAMMPLLRWRLVLLASAEVDIERARREAELMEASLDQMGDGAVPEHRIMAHFSLAKFWSTLNVRDRAFAHWVAGHELLKPFQPFSRADCLALFDATMAAFDPIRLRDGPRASNTDPVPVFIVGMLRSGTTLAEQILDAHRDCRGVGERLALGQTFHALAGPEDQAQAPHRVAALDADRLDQAAAAYLAELRDLAPGAARIVDKLPGNFLYLGLVGLMLPGARIIHCTRNPRDIGFSIFTFRFHGSHAYAHDLGDLGWYIGQHDRLMAHWRQALPNPILTVRLVDWVTDFETTLKRVLDFLDLPPDPNCARFHLSDRPVRTVSRAQVRQPVNARGLGRWRVHAEELAPLIAELDAAGSLDGWDTPADMNPGTTGAEP